MGACLLVLHTCTIFLKILTVMSNSEDPWLCQEEFCYSLVTQYGGISFSKAVDKCEENNSSLASIHSEEERQYVESISPYFQLPTQTSDVPELHVDEIYSWLYSTNPEYNIDRGRRLRSILYSRKASVGMPVWLGMKRSKNGRAWVDRSAVNYLPEPWNYHSAKNRKTCIYTSGDWYEGTCNNNLYFICKRKAEKKPSSYSILSKSTSEFWTTERTKWTPLTYTGMQKDYVSVATTLHFGDLSRTEKSNHSEDYERPYDEQQFKEMLKSLKVKKKKGSTKEAPGSQAIGVVAIIILLLIFTGVILLDLSTFRKNWKMFRRNVSRGRKQ